MSDGTTLLPCAHCGGKGKLVFYYDFYHVNCTNDDCVEHYDEGMIYRGEGAWYGSVADAIAAWNTRTHSTLTAEQVREAIERHVKFYEGGDYDEQAIADELNELGSGTCEPKWTLQGETQTQEFWRCECGNCGECFGVETRESFPLKMTIGEVDVPNFCPNCGKAAKR